MASPLEHVDLYLIATVPPAGVDRDWLERVAAAVRGGAQAVQLRDKDGDTSLRRTALSQLGERLSGRALVLVNDDIEALFTRDGTRLADGVHLGRDDAQALAQASNPHGTLLDGLKAARERLGPNLALGTSTRTRAEIEAALAAGVDHVGFGAMCVTTTKANTSPADPAVLTELFPSPPCPIFPIGGLGPEQIRSLGLTRAAVGSALLDVKDPEAAATACRRALEG